LGHFINVVLTALVALIGLLASLVGLGLYLSPDALDVYPKTALNRCDRRGGDNNRFVSDMLTGLPQGVSVRRTLYLDELYVINDMPGDPDVRGCVSDDDDTFFYTHGEQKAALEFNYPAGQELTIPDAQGASVSLNELVIGLPWSIQHAEALRISGPVHVDAMLKIRQGALDSRSAVIVVPVEQPDSVMQDRIACVLLKKRYAGWREPLACGLPTWALDLFG